MNFKHSPPLNSGPNFGDRECPLFSGFTVYVIRISRQCRTIQDIWRPGLIRKKLRPFSIHRHLLRQKNPCFFQVNNFIDLMNSLQLRFKLISPFMFNGLLVIKISFNRWITFLANRWRTSIVEKVYRRACLSDCPNSTTNACKTQSRGIDYIIIPYGRSEL